MIKNAQMLHRVRKIGDQKIMIYACLKGRK